MAESCEEFLWQLPQMPTVLHPPVIVIVFVFCHFFWSGHGEADPPQMPEQLCIPLSLSLWTLPLKGLQMQLFEVAKFYQTSDWVL